MKLRSLTFGEKIYVPSRRIPKRKLGNSFEIGYSKVATVDDVHPDENICGANQCAFSNTNAGEGNAVGQPDIYQIRLY